MANESPTPAASRRSVRYFVYRPPGLMCRADSLQPVDWESDADVSALVWLAVRLLVAPGRKAKKPDVYWLPLIDPDGNGATLVRRALVLRVPRTGATAIVSQVRLPSVRGFLAWTVTLSPQGAKPSAAEFAQHVAREASACAFRPS